MSTTLSRTEKFYSELSVIHSFAEAAEGRLHADVPGDWWVVITDVIGSTKAIEAGDYKKVNTVGVACIAAVINVDRNIDLPFVFGGDGATFAVPDVIKDRVVVALRAAQQLARESFGLALRVGLVRVADLTQRDHWVRLGKLRLSQHVMQPVLSGRGWEEAERRVKAPAAPGVIKVDEDGGPADGSFEGFECRWQNVPSFNDHKLSLLVAALSPDPEVNLATYQRVLNRIQTIYGDVSDYHPLRADHLRLTLRPRQLLHEWRVRSARSGLFRRVAYLAQMVGKNLAGMVIFAFKLNTGAVPWRGYRDELVENTDFRKFDGMLRMVLDGKTAQSESLQAALEAEYQEGYLAYGIHQSREALLTCIVQSYNGNHMHFVDGSDGGYALAARELKRRLRAVKRDAG